MYGPAPVPENPDSLLHCWLTETDPDRGRELFDRLVLQAERLMRRTVACALRGGRSSDRDDVCNNAIVSLISRLEKLKRDENPSPILNFIGYVQRVASNACSQYFREFYPERHSLAAELHYRIAHEPAFSCWEIDGIEVCGLATMHGLKPCTPLPSLSNTLDGLNPARLSRIELMDFIFRAVGAPMEFNAIVGLVADLLGVRQPVTETIEEAHESLSGPWPTVEQQLSARQYLAKLWSAIMELPLHQKRALMLNLRNSFGADIETFDQSGVASIHQIAEALEIEPMRFAELWKKLPLDDAGIATLCGIGIQAVINRRSSAHKRLKKRMKGLSHGR